MTSPQTITADAGHATRLSRPQQDEMARQILTRFGDKWSLEIMRSLAGEPTRFTQLQRKLSQARPISSRILALTLRHLERNGLVMHEIFPVVPPRVEYSLTPLGAEFHDLGARFLQWVSTSRPGFRAAHARYDAVEG